MAILVCFQAKWACVFDFAVTLIKVVMRFNAHQREGFAKCSITPRRQNGEEKRQEKALYEVPIHWVS